MIMGEKYQKDREGTRDVYGRLICQRCGMVLYMAPAPLEEMSAGISPGRGLKYQCRVHRDEWQAHDPMDHPRDEERSDVA